jgi:hypothetical protein
MVPVVNRELHKEWAGIADAYLGEAGLGDEPSNPWELAWAYGFMVVHGGGRARACCVGDVIAIDRTENEVRQAFVIAHELAHDAMRCCGYENVHDEAAADWIAGALLCPDRSVKADMRHFAWDLSRLRGRYMASWEVLARRIVDVKAAVVTIIDRPSNGPEHQHCRLWSSWLHTDYGQKPFAVEREAIEQAFDSRGHVYTRGNRISAYYVPSEGWERVLLLAGAEDLEEAVWGVPADVG